MKPAAIIFDLDDTLVASRPLWDAAERNLAEVLGLELSDAMQSSYQGRAADDVARILHDASERQVALDFACAEFRRLLVAAFAEGPVREVPGAVACCRQVSAAFPLAVASGSPLPVIKTALAALGLTDCFTAVVSSESVRRGKPAPDVFLAAASALGVAEHRCLVVEDSIPGVLAAKAAGMMCVALQPEAEAPAEIRANADGVVASLGDLDAEIARFAL